MKGYSVIKETVIGYGRFAHNVKREDGLFYQLLNDRTIADFAINAMLQSEAGNELKGVIVG